MKLRAWSHQKIKMAPRTRIVKMSAMLLTQFSLLLALNFQLFGMVTAYKMMEMKRNLSLATYLSARKSYLQRKRRHLQARRVRRKARSIWVINGRTDQWWQNMIGADVPEWCWKKNFRMSKECFYELADELRPYLAPHPDSPNRRALSTEKRLAITLYYLKDTGSLWMTANAFGIHQCTASKHIHSVCETINIILGEKYLHLPRDTEEMRRKVSEFEMRFGMTQAYGCIDGTHLPIKRPPQNSQDYFCYKQYFSLNIQAICDSKGYFMDVECKWPGSVHDAKVFANSSINHKMKAGQLPKTFINLLPGYEAIPNYLIGDPAYPLTPFCMKEYQTCATNEEVVFNNMLRSARNQIECAFGRLKVRWGFLTRKVDLKLEMVPTVAYSCFVLHNYCESKGISLDDEEVQAQIRRHRTEEERLANIPDPVYSCQTSEGEYVRSVLAKYIQQNLPDDY